MQPFNPDPGSPFAYGPRPSDYWLMSAPASYYPMPPWGADPRIGNDTFQAQKKPSQTPKKQAWYINFGKEVLKTGIVVAASVAGGIFGNVPGAIAAGGLTAAAVSMADQKLSKGKLDWGTVGIDTALGLIPGSVAGKLVKGGESLLSKMLGKKISAGAARSVQRAALSGAMDGAVMGYVGGGAQSAYDSGRKDGKIDWWKANVAGLKDMLPGILGGAAAGSALTRILRGHAIPPSQRTDELKPPRRTWANRLTAMLFLRSEDPLIANLHTVDAHVLRGAMPESEAAFNRLKKNHQVQTIIDLRGPGTTKPEHIQYEAAYARKHGLRYVSIPMDSTRAPNQAELQEFFAEIQQAQKNGEKVYVHCKHGIDRTGAMIAAYEVSLNRKRKAVYKNMQQCGYNFFHERSRPAQKAFVHDSRLPQWVKTAQQGAKVRLEAQAALHRQELDSSTYDRLIRHLDQGSITEASALLKAS